jgi:tetratricopeptide (TPR) repeat protein
MCSKSPSFGEASADDYYMLQTNYNTRSNLVQQAYIWNASGQSDYIFSNAPDWAYLYLVVYNANLCLEEIEQIERNTQNATSWDNIKGSSLFFRGRSFLRIAGIFSKAYDSSSSLQDLGIPLRLTSDFNVPSVRSNLKDTYERIILDLKASVPLLPDLPEQVLRPSKAASYAYLARTYLAMRNYDSAYRYADLCLTIKNDLIDYNDNSVVNSTASFPFTKFNSEVIHHEYDNSLSFSSITQANSRIDSNLARSYSNNDWRKVAFFKINGDGSCQFKGSYSGSGSWFTGVGTDEMYLTRAECAARLGKVTAAMDDLNTLLVKRWKTGTFTTVTALGIADALNKILIERRKELVFRDLRWIDIKRLNNEGANISITRIVNSQKYVLQPGDNRFALPLPTDIISLTSMPQNPQ